MRQVLIALDQLVNALAGGRATETISSRAYRCRWTLRMAFINALFCDPDHCENSFLANERRDRHLPFYDSE